jgi:hypothetical protein
MLLGWFLNRKMLFLIKFDNMWEVYTRHTSASDFFYHQPIENVWWESLFFLLNDMYLLKLTVDIGVVDVGAYTQPDGVVVFMFCWAFLGARKKREKWLDR